MNIIQKLPDDIILHIYTKCLKRYRLHEGQLIKRIDLDKYKFLEKYIYRRITTMRPFHSFNDDDDDEIRYIVQYQLSNLSDIDRNINAHRNRIDDDMICIEFTINNLSVHHRVEIFRLKKLEDIHINNHPGSPSIYYKGAYDDCDWEIVRYAYEI
jgi:hypothetical protein